MNLTTTHSRGLGRRAANQFKVERFKCDMYRIHFCFVHVQPTRPTGGELSQHGMPNSVFFFVVRRRTIEWYFVKYILHEWHMAYVALLSLHAIMSPKNMQHLYSGGHRAPQPERPYAFDRLCEQFYEHDHIACDAMWCCVNETNFDAVHSNVHINIVNICMIQFDWIRIRCGHLSRPPIVLSQWFV